LSSTLAVLLPVYNAQPNLPAEAADVLEVLSEWAVRFELVIVDDGSVEEGAEIVNELAARYPQVRVVRHRARLGLAAAIQSGIDFADGQVILIGNDAYQLDPDDLRTLWRLRDVERRAAGDVPLPGMQGRSGVKRSPAKGESNRGRWHGFEVVARSAFEALRGPSGRESRRAGLDGQFVRQDAPQPIAPRRDGRATARTSRT
jgi:glycosyltransferase involved in cell wall biosynthesis